MLLLLFFILKSQWRLQTAVLYIHQSQVWDNLQINTASGFFSSPGPKVHGNYCHHLAFVVCKLFIFQASSPKPLGQLEPSLAGMFHGWSSTKFLFFVPVRYSKWLPGPIIWSDWLKFQRSSSLKLMNWLNPNCFLCGSEIQDGCHRRT